jgi:hypothetical protein
LSGARASSRGALASSRRRLGGGRGASARGALPSSDHRHGGVELSPGAATLACTCRTYYRALRRPARETSDPPS